MNFKSLSRSSHLVRNVFLFVVLSGLLFLVWTRLPVVSPPPLPPPQILVVLHMEEQEWRKMFHDKVPYNPDVPTAEDSRLVSYLREGFLLAPPPADEPLNLTSQWVQDPSMGQAARIREILADMTDGFFIECGALDGETRSNTLVFERQLNWSGLLIEADPLNYESAVMKRRKVHLSNSCLSIRPYPMVVSFHQDHNLGKIEEDPMREQSDSHADVQCFPLYTYLLALNRTTVDYFSLDVEGHELEVLETVPWERVNIRTLSVEFIHGARSKSVLRAYMESKGYYVHSEVRHHNNLANDFIFVKRGAGS